MLAQAPSGCQALAYCHISVFISPIRVNGLALEAGALYPHLVGEGVANKAIDTPESSRATDQSSLVCVLEYTLLTCFQTSRLRGTIPHYMTPILCAHTKVLGQ